MKTKALFIILFSLFFVVFSFSQENTKTKQKGKNKVTSKTKSTDESDQDKYKKIDEMPSVINLVQPVYPESARKDKIEGTVYVSIFVNKEGKVGKAEIKKREGGSEDLEKAALEAALKTTFKPGIYKGEPVDVWVVMPFKFKLK